MVITDGLRIDGPGAGRLAVSGNDASRVFRIGSGVAASIDDLTVTHGRAIGQGGGILNAGILTLSHAILSDNQAVGGAAGDGGSAGLGIGGGLYLSPGGVACADLVTAILANDASTSDDDVFGSLIICP